MDTSLKNTRHRWLSRMRGWGQDWNCAVDLLWLYCVCTGVTAVFRQAIDMMCIKHKIMTHGSEKLILLMFLDKMTGLHAYALPYSNDTCKIVTWSHQYFLYDRSTFSKIWIINCFTFFFKCIPVGVPLVQYSQVLNKQPHTLIYFYFCQTTPTLFGSNECVPGASLLIIVGDDHCQIEMVKFHISNFFQNVGIYRWLSARLQ